MECQLGTYGKNGWLEKYPGISSTAKEEPATFF